MEQRREPTTTQPTYCGESENRSCATSVGGECSHHCAIPAPQDTFQAGGFEIFPRGRSKQMVAKMSIYVLWRLFWKCTVVSHPWDCSHSTESTVPLSSRKLPRKTPENWTKSHHNNNMKEESVAMLCIEQSWCGTSRVDLGPEDKGRECS